MWLEDMELAPPPRPVSLGAISQVLLGGALMQVACGILAFGGALTWPFATSADVSDLTHFAGALEVAKGEVVSVDATHVHVNDQPVQAFHYRFQGPDGVAREGVSYQSGLTLTSGDPVTVEFPAGDASVSRIVGMRRKTMPAGLLAILAIPGVGLLLLLLGLRGGLRRARLLRHGRRAEGKLVAKEPTNASVNDRPVMRLTFAFTDDEGRAQQVSTSTHQPEGLEDEPTERILYDPREPARAILVDSLPGSGQSTSLGGWEATTLAGPLLKLILPALALIVTAGGLLLLLAP